MQSSYIPQDNKAFRFPVSVKGVIFTDGKVVLLKNEREEWELPGGKLEPQEAPEACLMREISEELDIQVKVGGILDAWVYHISQGVDVLIVTYGCHPEPFSDIAHSSEHKALGLFRIEEIDSLNMPDGYKKSIQEWRRRSGSVEKFG